MKTKFNINIEKVGILLLIILLAYDMISYMMKSMMNKPEVWGPMVWKHMHLAATIRRWYTPDQWVGFLKRVEKKLPCEPCVQSFKEYQSITDAKKWVEVSPATGPMIWTHVLHNQINRKLKKTQKPLWKMEYNIMLDVGIPRHQANAIILGHQKEYNKNPELIELYKKFS
jgi:hypothetical protein